MSDEARRAYNSWKAQKQRCNNKKNPKYKYNGARGIRVQYNAREFISWWLKEQQKYGLEDPTCGRINHDKDYTFGNIRLEERSENTRERNSRCRYNRSRKLLCTDESGNQVLYYSIRAASRFTGISQSSLRRHIGTKKPVNNLIFEYYKD